MFKSRKVVQTHTCETEQVRLTAGLGRVILCWFLALSVIPLVINSLITTSEIRDRIHQDALLQLQTSNRATVHILNNWFSDKLRDVQLQASLPSNIQLYRSVQGLQTSVEKDEFSSQLQMSGSNERAGIEVFQSTHQTREALLLNLEGRVVWSQGEKHKSGKNILKDASKSESLAAAFTKLRKEGQAVFSDIQVQSKSGYSIFILDNLRNSAGGGLGVLAVRFSLDGVYAAMRHHAGIKSEQDAFLIAPDGKPLSPIQTIQEGMVRVNRDVLSQWSEIGSVDLVGTLNSSSGKISVAEYSDPTGREFFACITPLKLGKRSFALVTQIPADEAYAGFVPLAYGFWAMILLMIFIVTFSAIVVTRRIVLPILELADWVHQVSLGDLQQKKLTGRSDEIGSIHHSFSAVVEYLQELAESIRLAAEGDVDQVISERSPRDLLAKSVNTLITTMKQIERQAMSVAEGNYESSVTLRSESDKLGRALQSMTHNLRHEIWTKGGHSELTSLLRGHHEPAEIANKVITFLCRFLRAPIGAFFFFDAETNRLKMKGSYSYRRRKGVVNFFALGEGLVGQCALEKETIIVTDVPDDYISVASGLGSAAPDCLVAVPLIDSGEVRGVLELGRFGRFDEYSLAFLEEVSETISIAIFVAQGRRIMADLLAESKQKTEELEARERELHESNDELKKQTLLLKESEEAIRLKSNDLEQANGELKHQAESLAAQKSVILMKTRELERAKRELEVKAEDLERASQYKSEFLANMSHELRTPLNSLLILAQDLARNREGNLSKEQIEEAQIIYQGGKDLLGLINEILDLSKVEAGELEVHLEPVVLPDLQKRLESQFNHMAAKKNIDFSFKLKSSSCRRFISDSKRLEQILRNLISNAFKFTEGGKVVVVVSKTDDDFIQFGVRDTGIGIPEQKLETIFQAFKQVDGSTSRKYGGTGLGLSISRELASLLGGKLTVESVEGKGSTFSLFIPYKEAPEVIEEGAQVSEHLVPRIQPQLQSDDRKDVEQGDQILVVVEDDAFFGNFLIKMAHKRGFKCVVAESGREALELIEKHPPAAMIVDLGLPDMHGSKLIKEIRSRQQFSRIPIHIISASDVNNACLKLGADNWIVKPATEEDVELVFGDLEEVLDTSIERVLVAEDDPNTQKTIKKMLLRANERPLEVQIVEDREGTLEALRSNHYQCMILDLQLKDITGFQLLRELQKDMSVRIPPTIIYTGRMLSKDEVAELSGVTEKVIYKGEEIDVLLMEAGTFLSAISTEKFTASQAKLKNYPSEKALAKKEIAETEISDEAIKDKRVMLVDDDMRNSYALSKILKNHGLKVELADNGKLALEKLEKQDFDIILMDIMMPIMDGYEAMSEIRKQEKWNDLPIVALTANAMTGDEEKCRSVGADVYLSKPVDEDSLLHIVRICLTSGRN